MINEPNINSAILFHPESNYGLSKYMDITKFLKMIEELLTQYGINKKVHPSKLTKID